MTAKIKAIIMLQCLIWSNIAFANLVENIDCFGSKEHDFGDVIQGSSTSCTLSIENIYDEAITISEIKSSCACVNPDIEGIKIESHSSLDAVFPFNTEGRTGPRKYDLFIYFRQINKPFQVQLKGNVISICPKSIDFGKIKYNEQYARKFEIEQIESIKSLNYNHELFQIDWARTDSCVEIYIRTKNIYGHSGNIDEKIEITAIESKGEVIHLSTVIYGYILKTLEANNYRIFLGSHEAGEMINGTLEIYSPYGEEISNIEIKDENDAAIDILEVADVDTANVKIKFRMKCPENKRESKYISKKLSLSADVNEEKEEIYIQVYFLLKNLNEFSDDLAGENNKTTPIPKTSCSSLVSRSGRYQNSAEFGVRG